MRLVRAIALAAGAAFIGLALGHAQDSYPSRTVKIIVATGPGGATDVTARSVAQTLNESLGQYFVVENHPGARGLIGVNTMLREKRDGHTLLLMASSQSVLPAFYDLPYDPVGDFSPIALVTIVPVILVAKADLPVSSVAELVQYARKNPNEMTYGFQGGVTQLAAALFAKRAGFEATGVPFTASAQVATELVAGRLTFVMMTAEQAKPLADAGKLRVLATAGAKRASAFPDTPTLAELGLPIDSTGWFGLVGPRDLPQPVGDKLYATLKASYIGKPAQARLVDAGMEPADYGPAEFTARLKDEIERYIRIGRELGIKKIKL
jgi:tripartite-type tricarboxylate transporter receptor subunit TctC